MGRPLPSRSTSDPNSAADINTLSGAIEDMIDGSTAFTSITFTDTTGTAGLHTESGVLKYQGATIATGSGGSGVTKNQLIFTMMGAVNTGVAIQQALMGTAGTFRKCLIYSDAAPSSTITADVNKDGVSIFGTLPEIGAGENTGSSVYFSSATFNEFSVFTIDIDACPTGGTLGNNLSVCLPYS